MFGQQTIENTNRYFYILDYTNSPRQPVVSVKTFNSEYDLLEFILNRSLNNKDFTYHSLKKYKNGELHTLKIVSSPRFEILEVE